MTIWLILNLLAQEPAAPQGPASYWKFDETVAGTAANQVTGAPGGAPQGGPTVSALVPGLSYNANPGATPRSLLFDGTNDVVNVANFGTFNRTTVAVWIQRVAGGPAGRQTIVSYKESTVGGFVLSLNETNGTFNPRLWVHNGGWVFAEQATAIPADGSWVHLAGVYDGANILVYRNGAVVATTAAAGNMTTGVGPVTIGARSSSDQHWFPGNIDDVRIYQRALSAAEIAVLANGVPAPVQNAPVDGVLRVDLSWTAPPGAVTYTYNVKRAPAGTGTFATIGTATGTTYTDTSGAVGVAYDYTITAVSAAESGISNIWTATALAPPPRTNDHSEGLLDENCSCGSTARVPSPWPLLLAVALLAAGLVRKS
ncbi:MAG TPA: LamG domain-containing protein [Planctomycetota bacterium]